MNPLTTFIAQVKERLEKNTEAYYVEFYDGGTAEFFKHSKSDLTAAIQVIEVLREALGKIGNGQHCTACSCHCHKKASEALSKADSIVGGKGE